MTSCCHRPRMRWSGATGAIARGKNRSTGYGRKRRSVRAWRWTCGVKPKLKAGNKPLPHSIVHGLDKPGTFTTDSVLETIAVVHAREGTEKEGSSEHVRWGGAGKEAQQPALTAGYWVWAGRPVSGS